MKKKLALFGLLFVTLLSSSSHADVKITYGNPANPSKTVNTPTFSSEEVKTTGGGYDSLKYGNQYNFVNSSNTQTRDRYSSIEPYTNSLSEHVNEPHIDIIMNDKLIVGKNSSQTVTLNTKNIPDGSMVKLSMNDINGVFIPPYVKIMNNTATFTMHSSGYHSDLSYQITATYNGRNFSSGVGYNRGGYIDVSKDRNPYFLEINVDKEYLTSNSDDYTTVVVKTQNIANGTSLRPYINGNIQVEDSNVMNNIAIIRLISSNKTKDGVYTLTLNYKGNEQKVFIYVGEKSNMGTVTKSENIRGIKQERSLMASQTDSVTVDVETEGLPDGTFISGSVGGNLQLKELTVRVSKNKAKFVVINNGSVIGGTYPLYIRFGVQVASTNIVVDAKEKMKYNIPSHVTIGAYNEVKDNRYKLPMFDIYGNKTGEQLTENNGELLASGYFKASEHIVAVKATRDNYFNGRYKKQDTLVEISTKDLKDGEKLEIDLPKGFDYEGSLTIKDNKVTIRVYEKSNSIKSGVYDVALKYKNETAIFRVKAINAKEEESFRQAYFINVNQGASLTNAVRSRSNFSVRTNILDGSRLDVQIPSGFKFNSDRVTVKDGKAVFELETDNSVPEGNYKGLISYKGSVKTAFDIVVKGTRPDKVQATGFSKYITAITIAPNDFNTGVERTISVVIDTNGIKDGTRLYPKVLNNSNTGVGLKYDPAKYVIVNNNKAVFYVNQKMNTGAGSYTIEVEYQGYKTEAIISIV